MIVDLVFNDLSLEPLATSKQAARQRMTDLIKTVRTAVRQGQRCVKRGLRSQQDINHFQLGESYSIYNWRNDNNVPREEKTYFRSMAGNHPILHCSHDNELIARAGISDFKLAGRQAYAVGMGYLLRGISVSFLSSKQWDLTSLDLAVDVLDLEGELHSREIRVPHASRAAHIKAHHEWLEKIKKEGIGSGGDLLQKKDQLFPRLRFCPDAVKQLEKVRSFNILLERVVHELSVLEAYCQQWKEGPFDPQDIEGKMNPESVETLKRFKVEHTFKCSDGENRIFSWHTRLTGGERIYFFPDTTNQTLLIGHIGAHLPTVKFPK